MPQSRDPRQSLYDALRALEDRARASRGDKYARREVARVARAEHQTDLGVGGQRIAEFLHPDPDRRPKRPEASQVWALVRVWSRWSGQVVTDADQRYWNKLVRAAHQVPPAVVRRQDTKAATLGHPLSEVRDPFALQVHPVIEVAGAPSELPALPVYVRRAHDEALDQVVEEVLADGYTGARMVVLVGGSSTGKTRALWEAAHRLEEKSPGWRLWRPRPQALVEALLDRAGNGGLGPRTVLWLNELQGFLDEPGSGLGEDIAAALLDLVSSSGRGPILVVGTLWPGPDHWRRLTADPAQGQDLHAQARALLAARDLRIAEEFSGPSPALAQAAVADPRWKEALDHGRGRPTQYLAGGYDLVRRYENAEPPMRAVLDAAGDARRLGHTAPLPLAFLRTAAEGYLSDDDWKQLPREESETWFERCLEKLERASRGTAGPLTSTRPPVGGPPTGRLELADYLEQHLRRTRRYLAPPASLWDSAATCLADPGVHTALAVAAGARGRFRHAVVLARKAATAGDLRALIWLARMREGGGDRQGAEQLYRAAADAGDASALSQLARMRERARDPQGAEQLYRAAVDAANTWVLSQIARRREEAGDPQVAEQLARAAADAGDASALSQLARMREETGDLRAAEQLYREAADAGDTSALRKLARMRQVAGDQEGAEALARAAADGGDAGALSLLARMREEAGDPQGAEQLYRAAADAGDIGALYRLARMRAALGQSGHEEINRFGLTADGMPEKPWYPAGFGPISDSR